MKVNTYKIESMEDLAGLFSKAGSEAELPEDDYKKSIYGTLVHLKSMPVYELVFEPYLELAERCGMSSFNLKLSIETGRFYVWNVNLGGHCPKLEMRPVKLEHVVDLELMYEYHKEWAYELGVNINLNPTYEI